MDIRRSALSPLSGSLIQFLLGRTFHFQTKHNRFADAFGNFIERARLRVTGRDLGN
jgi:hypothetical protein